MRAAGLINSGSGKGRNEGKSHGHRIGEKGHGQPGEEPQDQPAAKRLAPSEEEAVFRRLAEITQPQKKTFGPGSDINASKFRDLHQLPLGWGRFHCIVFRLLGSIAQVKARGKEDMFKPKSGS